MQCSVTRRDFITLTYMIKTFDQQIIFAARLQDKTLILDNTCMYAHWVHWTVKEI